ncbi:sensor domain-containing protein [Inconstantimicrobium mannanitabidum]|uniref:Uncharacterized protein n=1 Tax=Inconstantimicrobium mannanitabidum TaxID=1604901 RepID=A0ACB5RF91_9CLOT|nr:bifunctional diguanylate cyclase/phosphodiesterase [Clostridium sp. TW13]GKX67531.1 hypothetical protein rsdtw13_27890 [Clostridium sp. TW13]
MHEIGDKPLAFFRTYRGLVCSTLGILFLLLGFIAILMIYIRRVEKMKLKLEKSNTTLMQIYDELAAKEEELRSQYNDMVISQNKLIQSEERYKLVVEATDDAIWDWHINTNKMFLAPRGYKMLEYDTKNYFNLKKIILSLLKQVDLSLSASEIDNYFKSKSHYYEDVLRIETKDGKYKWLNIKGKIVFDSNNKPCRIIGSISDITKLKKYQDNLEYQAYHDPLTGLCNRLSLDKKVGEHLGNARQDKVFGAMMFIDTDNFKFVNDTLGHIIGDKLLVQVSKKLMFFSNENISLFRFGGDEFIYYIENLSDREQLEILADNILKAFSEPVVIDENIINVTISMGISVFPDNGTDLDMLLKCADMAMFEVKERGKNGYYFFNEQLNDKILRRVNIEKYLKMALKNNEFVLYYQPQIDLKSKKIDGFEALVRWNSPELGLVSPEDFISIAEEIGFIVHLGEWILRSACSYISGLNAKFNTNYTVAVNISMMQLLQDNFTEVVCSIIKETGLNPNLLELEITESVLMQSPEISIGKLQVLLNMGIKIALDDFGTGYSSLSYLRTIPLTTLKIDKSFIDDIIDEESKTSIVESIITLGHKFGLIMVAEGIEKEDQLKYLEKCSCNKIQGYLFSKPLCCSDLEKHIQQEQ